MYLYKLYSEKRESKKPRTGGGGITGDGTESILHPRRNVRTTEGTMTTVVVMRRGVIFQRLSGSICTERKFSR